MENQSYDFWYNNPKFDQLDQFKEKYYVNDFYKNIVFNLNIPKVGNLVVMGTNRGVAFNLVIFLHVSTSLTIQPDRRVVSFLASTGF